MGIFLRDLRMIPNIVKWQDCKIFTKLVPSQTPSGTSHQRCSLKKIFLKIQNTSWENTCAGVCFFFKFIKNNTGVSSEICEIFKNTYFEEYLWTTASALPRVYKT